MKSSELDREKRDGRLEELNSELQQRVEELTKQLLEAKSELENQLAERRRAEEENVRLIESIELQRKRLDDIVASVPGIVWEAWGKPDEATQRIDYVSSYIETMLGYKVEDWLASPNFWLDLVHPDDKEEAAREFQSGEGGTNHFRWVAKDGRVLWVEASAAVVFDEDGNPLGMRGVTMDITERKQLENQIRKQNEILQNEHERLVALIANVDIGLVMTDKEGRFLLLNDTWVKQTGVPKEAIIGHNLAEFSDISPTAAAVEAILNKVLTTGEPIHLREFPVYSEAREVWYADSSILPLRDSDGAITGALLASIDATEKVRARQELEAQHALLETIFEDVPVGIVVYDQDMRIINLNTDYTNMTGLDIAEARGKILYDLIPETREREPAHRRALAGEALSLQDVSYRHLQSGQTLYCEIRYRPLKSTGGEIIGLVTTVIDTTERKLLEQQKDELIAVASHELKTPITAIKGYTQIALRNVMDSGNEKLVRTLGIVDEKANHLTRLINEMLDTSRVQSGTLPLREEPFNLGDLAREAMTSLELTVPDFTYTLDVPKTPMIVNADRQRIEQVLTNLIDNALKYSGSNHRVDIAIKQADHEVVTSVRDRGLGIPKEQQTHIFERFFRASNVSATNYGGLGLGLYISHNIITRHGGRMWVESKQGVGSTFYFALPLLKRKT